MRTPFRGLGIVALFGAATILAACGGGGSESAPAPAPAPKTEAAPAPAPAPAAAPAPATDAAAPAAVSQAAMDEAKAIYDTRCTPCHGADGTGNGAAAAALNPKPRNYTDAAWQATVPDAEIEKAILEGGAAVGKSPLMPPNPDLAAKPEVVTALRLKVRSFGQAAAPAAEGAAPAAPAAAAPAPTTP